MAAEIIKKNGSSLSSVITDVHNLTDDSFHISPQIHKRNDIQDSEFTMTSVKLFREGEKSGENILQAFKPNYGSSEEIIDTLFTNRDIILNELWDKTINIQSRVIDHNNTVVTCECLVDKEKGIFENRQFPSYLFSHLKIEKKPYVMVNVKTKAGSTRIDIFDGTQLVDKKYFQISDRWKEIESDDFNRPISGKIKL